jgi:hypothetical protein
MTVDRETVAKLVASGNSNVVLDAIEPYLPVLKRLGSQAVERFLDGVLNQDWARIDRELYAAMSEDERDALSATVLADARQAVKAAYESSRKWRGDLMQTLLSVVLSFV